MYYAMYVHHDCFKCEKLRKDNSILFLINILTLRPHTKLAGIISQNS